VKRRFPPLLAALFLAAGAFAAPVAETDELRLKALADDVEAQLALADEYLFGRNRPVNPVLAAYWYRKAADKGSAAGEYNLGCCCEHGWGVEKSLHRAYALYSRAAERGLAAALTRRAMLLYRGIPVEDLGSERFRELPADRVRAVDDLRRAAEAGYTPAKFELAMLLYGDPEMRRGHEAEIGRLAREAAEAPGADAAAKLFFARCLQHGIGVTPDPARAAELYRGAADAGDPRAMAMLGRMLEFGMGVKPDPAQAEKLYRQAAELGDPAGMTYHGDRLLGAGDAPAAREWYDRAAKLEYPPAYAKAGDCSAFGWGTAPDPAAAFKLYEQGAKLGDATAQYRLAKCCAEGRGTVPDPAAAVFWYKCSVAGGNRDAVRELGAALLRGEGVKPDPEEGRRLLEAAARAGDDAAAAILNGK
jgi:hypothetical protein